MEKIDIKSLTLPQLREAVLQMGLPAFRAGQIYQWLHQKSVRSFDEMTNLPKSLRDTLSQRCVLSSLRVRRKLSSKLDGTLKYLLECPDGNCVEAVLMEYHHGNSICISTQVGCRMGCAFCASTIGGLVRCLTPAEMLDEIYTVERDSGRKIGSVVLMGIGEPLDNYDNVLTFLRILSSAEGKNLSLRHLSLSTCGLVDRIDQLAKENLQLTLSISLHATNDTIRDKLMPINHKYKIEALLSACKRYFAATGRRISFEYALISGENDTPVHAQSLADLLHGFPCHVNLIPVNPVRERSFRQGSRDSIRKFQHILEANQINATIRRTLGEDINASCGQLRREEAALCKEEL